MRPPWNINNDYLLRWPRCINGMNDVDITRHLPFSKYESWKQN